jgi:hypothetical protein
MTTIVVESPIIEQSSRRTAEHRFFAGMSGLSGVHLLDRAAVGPDLAGRHRSLQHPSPTRPPRSRARAIDGGARRARRVRDARPLRDGAERRLTRDLCRGAERDHRVSGSSLLRVKIPTTISRSQAVDHDRNHRDDHRGLWTMADRRASSQPLPAMLCAFTLLALLIAFDLKSLGRAHRATVLGSAWVLFIELSAVVVRRTAAWHAFAIHVRSLMS